MAIIPLTAATSGVHTIRRLSAERIAFQRRLYVPAAAATPGIYSADNSGEGQAYILNSDGTLNSPSNPAATGSAVTIFAAGAGAYTVSDGYAATALTPAVFMDGIYCNGISAIIGPVKALPGDVFQLSVFVPNPADLVKNNPDLKNFTFPAESSIQLMMVPTNSASSSMVSQSGVFINIK